MSELAQMAKKAQTDAMASIAAGAQQSVEEMKKAVLAVVKQACPLGSRSMSCVNGSPRCLLNHARREIATPPTAS